jgi:hypothetical protein
MTRRILGSACTAVVLAATVAAAQGAGQGPTAAPTPGNQQRPADRITTPTPRTQTDQQVTLTGCLTREASDIVLASAMPSGNASSGVPGSTSTGPAGTAGAAAGSPAVGTTGTATRYRLSGERDLDQYIGQRVEIVGRMDPDAVKAPAGPTQLGTPGLGRPDGGVGTPGSSGIGTPGSSGVGTPGSSGVGTPGSSGVGTPGSAPPTPDARAPGQTPSAGAPGATPGPATPPASDAAARAAARTPMPHVTIMSVRTVGGTCQ